MIHVAVEIGRLVETIDRRSVPGFFLAMTLAVSLVAAMLLARPAFAENIEVTVKLDENNTDGDCSLREAIIAANTDAPRDAISGGPGSSPPEIRNDRRYPSDRTPVSEAA